MKLSLCLQSFVLAASLAGGAIAAQASTQLTLWEHEYEDVLKGFDVVLRDFEAKNSGITIKRAHYKTEDLQTQFQTAAMGGGGGDVVCAFCKHGHSDVAS